MTEIRKHLDFSIQKKNIDDEGIRIEGFASTDDVDRVGDVIPASAWDLSNYEKNQIILFNHNYDEPIGKAEEVEVRDNGLYIKCLIDPQTKAGRQIENDVLKSFSVGFLLKDAKYDSNTNTFVLTDVELLEVSVVSVPANPAATFSLEKSCDDKEFSVLMKKFGQVEPEDKGVIPDIEEKETMSGTTPTDPVAPEPNPMDALASTLEKTFERFEKRMEEKLAAATPAPEPTPAPTVKEVDTGAERLMADIEKKFSDMNADTAKVIDELKGELKQKAEEIEQMNDSKRRFPGGGDTNPHTLDDETKKELVHAHIFGVISGKGLETDFAKRVMQKADLDIVRDNGTGSLMDDTIQSTIRKEIEMNLRAAALFQRIPVTSAATTLPISGDVESAVFQTGPSNGAEGHDTKGTSGGNLQGRTGSVSAASSTPADKYTVKEKTLNAYRLISQTYISNDTEEQIILNLMPLITDRVVRAHARAMENMVLNGSGSIVGFLTNYDHATTANRNGYAIRGVTTNGAPAATNDTLLAKELMAARRLLGIYGLNPGDVTYIVPINGYYNLIEDTGFADMNLVGNMATKVQGMIGTVYGSPVIVTDMFPDNADAGDPLALAVNPMNYVIPQLRNLTLESDYEVGNQRKVVVAYQSTGFEDMVEGASAASYVSNKG